MLINKFFHYFNKISPVIVQTPWVGVIGNCAEEMYYGLMRARSEGKRVLMLFPYDLFWVFKFSKWGLGVNRELLKVQSPYRFSSYGGIIGRVGNWLVTLVYCLFRIINVCLLKFCKKWLPRSYITPEIGRTGLWMRNRERSFSPEKAKSYNWQEQYAQKLPVDLPKASRREAGHTLAEMGLSTKAWFVCIHVREGGYYKHKEGKGKQIRNCSIENYLKAMELITAAGGWVIRMGDASMTPLPAMERVVDYPHTPFKSQLMDIYLLKECRFFLGGQSGIWDVASFFQRPLVIPNSVGQILVPPPRKGDLGIPKHIYSHSLNRFLSVKESFTVFAECEYLKTEDLEYHENTSDEICEVVKELFEGSSKTGYSELQEEWLRSCKKASYEILSKITISKNAHIDLLAKYRIASCLEAGAGTIGHSFVEQNWEQNTMNAGLVDRHQWHMHR